MTLIRKRYAILALIGVIILVSAAVYALRTPLGITSEAANVMIRVTDGSAPVAGASVQLNGDTKLTGNDGTAGFKVDPGSFTYSVVKDGYIDITSEDQVHVKSDVPVELAAAKPLDQYIVNDRSPRFVYTPMDNPLTKQIEGWFMANLGPQKVNQSYDADNHRTTIKDALASFEFTGSQIKLFVQGVTQGGLAEVRLDGGKPEVVDTYSPKRLDYMLVYEKYGLSPGEHKIEITTLGRNSLGKSMANYVQLDFADLSDMPVIAPFTPDDLHADFTSLTASARVASWGERGKEGMQEAGFVIAENRAPTIQDRRVTALPDKMNRLTVTLDQLKQDSEYHVRPYVVMDHKVYYGRDAVLATKAQIELSKTVTGLLVGEQTAIAIKKLNMQSNDVTWNIAKQSDYAGADKDVVNLSVNSSGNGATITGKSEGEAVIRVSSKNQPDIYSEVLVTVARKEKNPKLAQTPPMGWNSWNVFGRVVDSGQIKKIIDGMTTPITEDSKSLKDLGYEYVVVDGGWRQNWLDPDGSIVPNSYFGGKQGMKELADYAHSKGLKLGLHVLPGLKDCVDQYVGAKGNERKHLEEYKEWGIDYLKWDKCGGYGDDTPAADIFKRIKYFMDNAGRDIVFSISNYTFATWEPEVGNMWRTTGDIRTIVNSTGATWDNYMDIAEKNSKSWTSASPGGWNDPDMMVVGDPGINRTEWISHFNLWSIMSAPLMLALDLTDVRAKMEELEIVSNPEVIAVDQDALGKQGRPVNQTNEYEIWAKPLADGEMALLLMNKSGQPEDITVKWDAISYDASHKLMSDSYEVRDLWSHKDLGSFQSSYTASNVPVHGTVMLKVKALSR